MQQAKITRSYSRKIFPKQYEAEDFFCSVEAIVENEEPKEVSQTLHQFCVDEVNKNIQERLNGLEKELSKEDEPF